MHVWIQGIWRYATVAETPSAVSVLNAVVNRMAVDRLEVSNEQIILAGSTAPDGNSTAEYERLLGESQKWASQVKEGNLRKMDARLALGSTI
jgi:hypothetical protein